MIHNSKIRNGNFTSSEIAALTSEPTAAAKKLGSIFGKPAFTFIEEKNFERLLGRSIDNEVDAKPLTWGKLLESRVFDLLGMEYLLTSQETDVHPEIPYWVGSKDGIKNDDGSTVIDIKCPMTLKSFCRLVSPLYSGVDGLEAMQWIRDNHKDGEKYYWQLVSNAAINDCRFAELIVYMPYQSELAEIKLSADGQANCYWVAMAMDEELPYLKEGGYFKNLNIIRFEVPDSEKEFLKERVLAAGKMLIKNYEEEKAPELN